jgi:hypothetical protein
MWGLRPESEVLLGHLIAYAGNKIPTRKFVVWGTRLQWRGVPAWYSLIMLLVLLGDHRGTQLRARLHHAQNRVASDHADDVRVVGAR